MYKVDRPELFKNNLLRMSRPMGVDRMDADIMNALTWASKRARNDKDRVFRRKLILGCFDLVQIKSKPEDHLRWAK
jgi:hypothetical protein